jgi:hypothetical protein
MNNVEEGPQAEVEMTIGLAKVASILLAKASQKSGDDHRAILQDISLRYGV